MNTMDEQLWAYIDGNCTTQEREAIDELIATDKIWREKYQELLIFNAELAAMELDEPPMAFTYNVLEGIRADYARQPLKTTINGTVIKLIGGFFIITVLVMLVGIMVNLNWSAANPPVNVGKTILVTSSFFTAPLFKCFMFADVILGLFLFNEYLRRRKLFGQA